MGFVIVNQPSYDGPALPPGDLPEFSRRLNRLIRARCAASPGVRLNNNAQMARWLADAGEPISARYIQFLRQGVHGQPSGRLLAALALVLDVSPLVWFDESAYAAECVRLEEAAEHSDR